MATNTHMLEIVEPATGDVMARVPEASPEDADAAIASAKAALPGWRAVSPGDRARLLLRIAEAVEAELENLARLEARNAGKPIAANARGEIATVVSTFRYYAGAPERLMGDTIPVA